MWKNVILDSIIALQGMCENHPSKRLSIHPSIHPSIQIKLIGPLGFNLIFVCTQEAIKRVGENNNNFFSKGPK
jgi:hypothetical protein